MAQVAPSDSIRVVPYSKPDTMGLIPPPAPGDTSFNMPDTLPIVTPTVSPESLLAESLSTVITPTVYHDRTYISKGPEDDIKSLPGIFISSPGTVGSPAIPLEYLNVSAIEITLNGLPFPYQGLYRPYVTGTDLNTIPWEILNDISWNQGSGQLNGLDFRLGRPPDNSNRSDVDVARGPYSYEGARWRFFRPFGKKTYAYFTVGFKKSVGYFENSDYNGFHVTGGISRKIGQGVLSLDLWQHRAKSGLNSYDFLAPQESRQQRTIDRGEARYRISAGDRYFLTLTGLLQSSNQKIGGYNSEVKENYKVGGGQVCLSDSTSGRILYGTFKYYLYTLSKLPGVMPRVSEVEPSLRLRGHLNLINYDLRAAWSWNKIDHSAILPSARLSYQTNSGQTPYVEFSRSRKEPDLNLLYFSDSVLGLNIGQLLNSYKFVGNPDLSMPLTTQGTLGLESDWGKIQSGIGVSLKKIKSQIILFYTKDATGNIVVAPINYNDTFAELFAKAKAEYGPFTGELSGAYRKWSTRFFPDGLEKGPAALGFARVSFLKEFFIPRLYLGGSLEARVSTRRDYRSITTGLTDSFVPLAGRLEFRYKDLTMWLTDENLLNANYIAWWPYPQTPRIVWFGIMWNFFD
jgi:hypothetical protein